MDQFNYAALGQMAGGSGWGSGGYGQASYGPTSFQAPQGFQMSGDPNAGATNFSNYTTNQNYTTNNDNTSTNNNTYSWSNPINYTGGASSYYFGGGGAQQHPPPPPPPPRPGGPPPPPPPRPPVGPTSNIVTPGGQAINAFGGSWGTNSQGRAQQYTYRPIEQFNGGGTVGGFNGGPAMGSPGITPVPIRW